MARLRRPGSAQALCDHGLFRGASALQILSGLGQIFAEGLTGIIGAAEAPIEPGPGSSAWEAGDGAFHGTEKVDQVEVFISHTWSSDRWPKYLSMCYFLNLRLAVKAALVTWVLGIGGLTALHVEIFCGREYILLLVTDLPVFLFLVFFFFGQHLTGGLWAPTFWLDKLCIHQVDQSLKAQQVPALPVFVARSNRMLVLWDSTYFERLWCNMEMATFAKYAGTPDKMEFLPLWLAPWLISSLLLDLVGVALTRIMVSLPGIEKCILGMMSIAKEFLGESQCVEHFLHSFLEVFPYFVCYLPVALPTVISFASKLQRHQQMLEQMASFDLKNAKCTVEADRLLVEEQVALHFQPENDTEVITAGRCLEAASGNPEPAALHEEALERFNNYVQGPLRANCLDGIGEPCDLPLYLCYICFLPIASYNSVSVIPFAFRACRMTWLTMGFSSQLHQTMMFAWGWLSAQVLVYPVTFPLLLHLLHCTGLAGDGGVVQKFLRFLCGCLAYMYAFFCSGLLWGLGVANATNKGDCPRLLAVYLLYIAFLALQLWFFFRPRRKRSCSCRCLEVDGEAAKPMLEPRGYREDD